LTGFTQEFNQISLGAGYSEAVYFDLAEARSTPVTHDSWDIAFRTDRFDLGIFVNEAVGLSFTSSLPQVELYLTNSSDFASVDTLNMTRIYNDEVAWSAGAFNHVSDSDAPADYGWGNYDFSTHQVLGTRIFVIKPRNSIYKKLVIESLISGVYTFKYANLDGSNEITETINKADFPENTLAYYSFESEAVVDIEPTKWDLLFTRYTTPLQAGESSTVQYIVTGALQNAGVKVAEVQGIDPSTADFEDYADNYSDTLNTIGYDWKTFQGAWSIPEDRVYFIKTQGKIWKVQFIDFEGSSTGTITIEKTLVGEVTSTEELFAQSSTFQVYPNPATDHTHLVFDVLQPATKARISIYNQLGQLVQTQNIQVNQGLNAMYLPLQVSAGLYQVVLQLEGQQLTRTLFVQ
ncbi:MAG: HmuY family protein, partial [Bacteroidota bacterium]